jgi:hypothetical protein
LPGLTAGDGAALAEEEGELDAEADGGGAADVGGGGSGELTAGTELDGAPFATDVDAGASCFRT